MNILVTGGLGAIGRPLTAELRRRGHEVWTADRDHASAPQHIRCDVSQFRQVEATLRTADFDLVYHLAAEFGRWNGEDFYETMWLSNAVGTKHMIRMQERLGYRMVFASSSEVYGDYSGIMREDVLPDAAPRLLNDYAISKWVNETQILNSAEANGTETVRVRLFNTYGPGEPYSPYRSVICRWVYHALHRQPYVVYRGHRRTSTYIDDAIHALANIGDHFQPGEVYNIASSCLHEMKTASDIILEQLGLDDSLVDYRDVEPFTTRDKVVDNAKATQDLGMRTTVDLDEGISRTIEWQRSVYAD